MGSYCELMILYMQGSAVIDSITAERALSKCMICTERPHMCGRSLACWLFTEQHLQLYIMSCSSVIRLL